MLISLETNEAEMASMSTDLVQLTISEMLRAQRLGYHVIVMERSVADWILDNVSLNEIESATLKRLRSYATQTLGLIGRARTYLRLSANVEGTFRRIGTAVEISFNEAAKVRIFDPPILLLEDSQSDGALYRELLNALHIRLRTPHPRWDVAHGGGDRIINVFEQQVKQERIVVAIYDSDALCPGHRNSDKEDKLRAISESSGGPLAFCASPPCHEAENVVPLDLIANTRYLDQNPSISRLQRIDAREKSSGSDLGNYYWLHFDPKDGINPERYAAIHHQEAKKWISAKLALVELDPNQHSLQGFGGRIIPVILGDRVATRNLIERVRRNDWIAVFGSFFEEILWIFAGMPRVIT